MSIVLIYPRNDGVIKVQPRWPYRYIAISPKALGQLEKAQGKLPSGIRLILTRGFEPGGQILKRLHAVGRILGSILFVILYPKRANERVEIFSPNGHDKDGNHIDICIECDGRKKSLLPLGVFSSSSQVSKSLMENRDILKVVYECLEESGFSIHRNPTEALQIHADLVLQ